MKDYQKRAAVCLILLCVFAAFAQAADKTRTGNTGAQELLIPVGAGGIALGQTDMIFALGADALYWNPAGLSRQGPSVDAMFSHMQYIADIGVDYGAIGIKAGDFGSIGFSLKSIAFGDIPVTTDDFPDGTGSTFSPTFVDLGATYSKLLTDRISVGATATVVTERILSTSATGFAFDFGIQYFGLGIPELNLAITVNNVGPDMTFNGPDLLVQANAPSSLRGNQYYAVQAATFQLPSSFQVGLGYQRKINEQNSFLVGANFQNNNSGDDIFGFGGEYSYNNLLFVRGSYLFPSQPDTDPVTNSGNTYLYDWALGGGLNYDLSGVSVKVDYAYRHLKLMDANNVFTVRLGF